MSNRSMWGAPKGWLDAGGDRSWDDYGGRWLRQERGTGGQTVGGVWWWLDFTNMEDACGSDHDPDELYICEVKRLDFADLDDTEIRSAIESCGYTEDQGFDWYEPGARRTPQQWAALAEVCLSYGLGAPMHTETGPNRPIIVRGRARREAERLMQDDRATERQLDRPVNKIGSTAREYGRGDINSAMARMTDGPERDIMDRLHGITRIKQP